jgi:hypothetical protein
MNTTYPSHGSARQPGRPRRVGRILLAAVGLMASACDTAQQVPWDTYNSGFQQQIDAATATGNCAALSGHLAPAKATNSAHEKATGFPNDALVSYIQAAQHQAGCPAATG